MTATTTETKICRGCSNEKPLTEFHKHSATKDRLQVVCKACQAVQNRDWKARNPDKLAEYERTRTPRTPEERRRMQLWRQYKMLPADYDALVERQGGRCAICNEVPPLLANGALNLHVDHCHNTDTVRGLLCQNCNLALGHMKDDVERLRAAIAYLEEKC